MRPYHLCVIFALWCASMVVIGTGGWRHAVAVATLPAVYTVGK